MTLRVASSFRVHDSGGVVEVYEVATGAAVAIDTRMASLLARVAAGDSSVSPHDPEVQALREAGLLSDAEGHPAAGDALRSRRSVLTAASIIGVTTMVLPSAAAAASGPEPEVEPQGVAPSGDGAGGATINFSWASQPVQFRLAWIRPASEDSTPFQYEVEVTATYVAPGNTPASPSSFTYGPYNALASTQFWYNGPTPRVWYPDSWYTSGLSFPSATGNTFTAVFRSLTTPSTTITKTLIG
jgi:hypothetical protein